MSSSLPPNSHHFYCFTLASKQKSFLAAPARIKQILRVLTSVLLLQSGYYFLLKPAPVRADPPLCNQQFIAAGTKIYPLNTADGSYGTPLATMTSNGSAAIGYDKITNRVYYAEYTSPSSKLYYYDVATNQTVDTGVSVPLNSGQYVQRMAFTANGTGYLLTQDSILYRFTTATTPVLTNLGTITIADGSPVSNYASGDIAFDGNGTLWLVANLGSAAPATAQPILFNLDLSQSPAKAYKVGNIGSVGTRVNGLAFDPNGTLYATGKSNGSEFVYTLNLATGVGTQLPSNNSSNGGVGDMGSCAFPAVAPSITSSKSVGSTGAVTPGSTLTYTIDILNSGNAPAANLSFLDTLPTGTTYVSNSYTLNGVNQNATSYPFGSAVTVNGVDALVGGLYAGQSKKATISFQVKVNSNATGTISNQATINTFGSPSILTDDPTVIGTSDPTVSTISGGGTPLGGISGTVFEDPNYGGGAGRPLSAVATSPRDGATVELYKGDGSYVSSTTTSGGGKYTFSNVSSGDYFVRVVNSTVTSSRGTGSILPVQTFRVNDSTGTPANDTDRVGGEKPSVADTGVAGTGAVLNTTNFTFTTAGGSAVQNAQAQSMAPVKVGSSAVTGIDFGYNFDTIVNTNDNGQGSLRQFITNANALGGEATLAQSGNRQNVSGVNQPLPAGKETSIFMIADGQVHPGLRAGLANQLNANGVAVITPTDTYLITGANSSNTFVDGTTQTANIGDTNAGQFGTGGTVGVGADGVAGTGDEPTLSKVNKPEVQIVGATAITHGIRNDSANNAVRGLSIYGFGGWGNIYANGSPNLLVEGNYVGFSASSFANAGVSSRNGITFDVAGSSGTIRNNLICFNTYTGVLVQPDGGSVTIYNNEICNNNLDNNTTEDGVGFNQPSSNATVSGNLIVNNGSVGVDIYQTGGIVSVVNNTISGNGVSTGINVENMGVRAWTNNATIKNNIISANYGAGVLVEDGSKNTISQNSIFANGTITNRAGAGPTNQIGIDLLKSGDLDYAGTAPFVSANDGVFVGTSGNNGMDYPIITSSTLSGSTLTVKGFVGNNPSSSATFANATLEFFVSEGTNQNNGEVILGDAKSKPHGEGKTYIGTCNADANGLFNCTFANAGVIGVTNANNITATATDSVGNTSEFSSLPSASNPNVLLVKRITAINGDRIKNPNDNTPLNIFVDDTTSSKAAEDNNSNWVTNYLKGAINAGKVKPSDEIEYTIYFLSAGNASASGVRICDRLEPNQTFQPKGYGTGTGIQLQLGTSPVIDLTNINDASDRTQFIPAGATVPTNCNITGTNTDGTIIVDVTGAAGTGNPTLTALPEATGAGTPNDSYGFFRFIIKVNP